ncbi:MAG: right-handed parallel beta-helix repeat-containing protein [Bacteroidetes bacterium]|nr:right-handed parallel beta-helix repeat-containing protein [Bacteroidota bacterium]MBL7104211.1 right-handed parallel beta-helix repeat-containing protein [Bacteroidales bacterium]
MKKLFLLPILLFLFQNQISATIIIVDQSGGGDYTTIVEGIVNSNTGDTVLVYPGTYYEIVNFYGKEITVASLFLTTQDTSYINQTVIDGNNENYRLVRFANGETENSILIGFTITNASYPYAEQITLIPTGLGIYINNSSPAIENNKIINNAYNDLYFVGGGIVLVNSSAIIKNNTIQNNEGAYRGGGIYMFNSTNVTIENNFIKSNSINSGFGVSHGGGIYIDSSQNIMIQNNIISNNFNDFGYGGGIYIYDSENITILKNRVSNNIVRGPGGGGIYFEFSSGIHIINNLLYNNRAGNSGGGIYSQNSGAFLVNNTFYNNKADTVSVYGKGGGLYCDESSPALYNCIFFNNWASSSGHQVFLNSDSSDPDFYFCDVEGGAEAFGLGSGVVYNGIYENNIDAYPQFTGSGAHPFSLDNSSPCINAGKSDTAGLHIPEYDLAGNLRIVNDTIDIGAYEYQFGTYINNHSCNTELIIYPNPGNGRFTIELEAMPQNIGVEVFNSAGSKVRSFILYKTQVSIDLTGLPKGLYFIKAKNNDFIKTEKLIIY